MFEKETAAFNFYLILIKKIIGAGGIIRVNHLKNLRHKNIQVNGVKLHVVEAGNPNGELLILLHGFPEFWYAWSHQILDLAEAGLHVVVPDQRGYNLSEKPASVSAYRITELRQDICELIKHYGQKNCFLAGHDWGAAVAWDLAIHHPKKIKKLAILNVPHPKIMLRFLTTRPKQILKSWYIFFFQLPYLPELFFKRKDFRAGVLALKKGTKRHTFTQEEIKTYKEAWSQPSAITAMLNWYRALGRSKPKLPKDARVKVPTLMIWGKKDLALSYKMAQPSIDLCDQGKLIFFEDSSHWVQHEKAKEVTKLFLDFFK